MPPIKESTAREREFIFSAIEHINDGLKLHPTIDLIAKHCSLPSKETRAIVSKMSREGWLTNDFVGNKEYIYRTKKL